VDNGHTVPAVETLEKFTGVLEVPMYQLFLRRPRSTEARLEAALDAHVRAEPERVSRRWKCYKSYSEK
jgi:hypothetical protein